MKKLLYVPFCFILLLTLNCVVHADVGLTQDNFPDETFLNYISQFDLNSNGSLSDEECNSVTNIDVGFLDLNIHTLDGIQYFPMLESLDCSWNKLVSLDLSQNKNLTYLECHNNPLVQLNVSENTRLTGLICNQCRITSLDLRNCTKLHRLECQDNRLSSLLVGTNNVLQYLDCKDNNLTTLDVSGLPALDRFRCERNELTSLNLGQNTSLISLTCDENHLEELDLSGTPNLHFLGCNLNDLTRLDLSHCPRLESILVDEYKEEYPNLEYYIYTSVLDWEYYFSCDKNVPLILAGLPTYAEPTVSVEDEYIYYSSPHYYVMNSDAQYNYMLFVKKGNILMYHSYLDPLVPEADGSTKLIGVSFLENPDYQVYLEPAEYEAVLIMSGEGHKDTIYHYPFGIVNPYLPDPEITGMTPEQPDTSHPVSFGLSQEYEKIKVQLYLFDYYEEKDLWDYRPLWDEAEEFQSTDTFSFPVSEEGSYKITFTCEKEGKQSREQDYWFYVVSSDIPTPDLVLPNNTRVIEDEAFFGIENVVIRLPGTVESISETAFDPSVTIIAPEGSPAAEICRGLGLNVIEN